MVTIRACNSYSPEVVDKALDQSLQDLGGLESFVQAGETVLLKVNLVIGKGPEKAATTHPALVAALARKLIALGCRVLIGDSPGGPFNPATLKIQYQITGMADAAKESGAELCYDTSQEEVQLPEGVMLKRLTLTGMSQKADKVISLCKLKTHSMMVYTGAAKNMFGTIPGTTKAEYHVRMPEIPDFAEAIIDICEATRPALSVMDAVIGMEGNGPTGGSPRAIGCLLASANPYELDLAAASLIGLGPKDVYTLSSSIRRGLTPEKPELIGDDPSPYIIEDFRMPDHVHTNLQQGGLLPPFLMKARRPKVVFDPQKCLGCGHCADNCPAKVITMKPVTGKAASRTKARRLPSVDYRRCIRCYCCQELCPQVAVKIRESLIFKIANRI